MTGASKCGGWICFEAFFQRSAEIAHKALHTRLTLVFLFDDFFVKLDKNTKAILEELPQPNSVFQHERTRLRDGVVTVFTAVL